MPLYESTNFAAQNLVLIYAKDQQLMRFATFTEVLESISCFVINGDNRFDPLPRPPTPSSQAHFEDQEKKITFLCNHVSKGFRVVASAQ